MDPGEAFEQGNIPGGYWAVLTHPATDRPLVEDAFGQVHMLSWSKQKYSMPRPVNPASSTMAELKFLKFAIRPTLTPGSWT